MLRITKRDGTLQELELAKIQRALLMAFNAVGEIPNVSPLVHRVVEKLDDQITVDQVSEACERVLLESGYPKVAAGYMRYRVSRDELRARRLIPDSGALSNYIHVAKYAKHIVTRRELYYETVNRVYNMHLKRFDCKQAIQMVHRKEIMPSMRSMQFGGLAIEKNNARMYNCSFTHIDRWEAFSQAFWLLLSGCGVGYSVQWHHVEQLSEIKRINKKDVRYWVVEDSIEGWADAEAELIRSYQEGYYVEFSYHKIRKEGEPLKTSGGLAPGHLGLKASLEAIRGVLDRAAGRKLRPIEAHDILCYSAEGVLSGGIRRSSLICLFSANDTEMLYAKASGNFDPVIGLNAQREMANNSAVLLRGATERSVFDRVIRIANENYGDPGFYFTDSLEYGCNPCGEIGMWPVLYKLVNGRYKKYSGWQFCNLCEVNMATCVDEEDFYARCRAAAFLGTLQATYTDFPYLGWVSEEIAKRDALIGVGIMGMMDNAELAFDPKVLRTGAQIVVEENALVAKMLGINKAKRCCTIKPGGTAPLEAGVVSAGISPRWARRTLYRVTANRTEAAFHYFKSINPHMCEEKPNGDWVITFPIQAKDGALTLREMDAASFVEKVFTVYDNWIIPGTREGNLTHNVSATVVLREGEDVTDLIWENRKRIAAMSFAPYLIDKKFRYAPREAIRDARDEAYWNHLISLYKPVNWREFKEEKDTTTLRQTIACSGGACEIL